MTTSSSAVLPARSPIPLTAHSICVAPAFTSLSELANDPKHGWSQRPVALILSKADRHEECFEDPAAYAKAHAAGLWQYCQERFHCHKFFAAGVAGACAWRESISDGRVQVPLRIEPHGIVEPFDWLLDRLGSKRGKG